VVLEVYDWVCQIRKTHTVDYISKRQDKKVEVNEQTSRFVKCGRLLKKMFIVVVILIMVGPTIYERYNVFMGNKTADPAKQFMNQQKTPKTAKEARNAAMKREKQ